MLKCVLYMLQAFFFFEIMILYSCVRELGSTDCQVWDNRFFYRFVLHKWTTSTESHNVHVVFRDQGDRKGLSRRRLGMYFVTAGSLLVLYKGAVKVIFFHLQRLMCQTSYWSIGYGQWGFVCVCACTPLTVRLWECSSSQLMQFLASFLYTRVVTLSSNARVDLYRRFVFLGLFIFSVSCDALTRVRKVGIWVISDASSATRCYCKCSIKSQISCYVSSQISTGFLMWILKMHSSLYNRKTLQCN